MGIPIPVLEAVIKAVEAATHAYLQERHGDCGDPLYCGVSFPWNKCCVRLRNGKQRAELDDDIILHTVSDLLHYGRSRFSAIRCVGVVAMRQLDDIVATEFRDINAKWLES